MSGGHFEYQDSSLKYEIFGYDDGVRRTNPLEDIEISDLVYDVLDLLHDFDWYKSGDTCEEDYLKAKNKFKKKWFGSNRKIRMKEYIDQTWEETREELYKTFGVEELT